jgi:hypothetical protein
MGRGGVLSGFNWDAVLDSARTALVAVAAMLLYVENARILLGPDFGHRHYSIHDSCALARMAEICWNGTRCGAGRGLGNVLSSDRGDLCRRDYCVRLARVATSRGRGLPIRRYYVEYHSADSPNASAVDHGMAPVSGSVAWNCSGAGGHDHLAADEEESVVSHERAVRFHPLLSDCFPCVLERFVTSVLRQPGRQGGVAQQTYDICGEGFFVVHE